VGTAREGRAFCPPYACWLAAKACSDDLEPSEDIIAGLAPAIAMQSAVPHNRDGRDKIPAMMVPYEGRALDRTSSDRLVCSPAIPALGRHGPGNG